MKRAVVITGLLCSACIQNHRDLREVLVENERILAEEQLVADSLNEARKEADRLEALVNEGLRANPELKPEVDALRAKPKTVGPVPLPMPPPEGTFEGAEGARLRAHIADTQARILQLRRVTGEVSSIDGDTKRLEAALKLIEARRAK